MTERDPLLVEREKTHGSFAENAQLYCKIMKVIDQHNGLLNDQQHCALDMIAIKIARACCNPKIKDTWNDIAGYAKLGSEACD